ncbi:hypothetical protein DSM112329_03812 [Paraconexibacter sp. AEG42_29]|uniref:Uncharacterized protein n=1 Tax=Paraconexibacter sp. AEG42_29 TaxID=2997339 RepID=A0AAU7B037_9ACTN
MRTETLRLAGAAAVSAAALLLAAVPAAPAAVAVPPPGALVTDEPVVDLAAFGDRIYARGEFTHAGEYTGPGITIDTGSGALARSVVPLNGQISDVEPDGAGGWFVGGSFSVSGRMPHRNVAHIRADGTTDEAFQAGTNGLVTALAYDGRRLFVAGGFTTVNGTNRGGVAAVDAATGATLPFDAKQSGAATEMVLAPATAVRPARLFVGMRQILALDPETGAPVRGFTSNINADIRALAVDDQHLYVGGNGIAALNPDTGDRDPAFKADPRNLADDPIFTGTVQTLVRDGGRLLAGGQFNALGGAAGPLVALDPASGVADRTFRPQITASTVPDPDGDGDSGNDVPDVGVFDITRVGSALWVGGLFQTAGGSTAENLAALDPASGDRAAPHSLPYLGGQVNGVAGGAGGRLFVGGYMSIAGAREVRSGLMALDGRTLAVDPRFSPFGDISFLPMLPGPGHVVFAANRFDGYAHVKRARFEPTRTTIAVRDARTGEPAPGFAKVRNLTGVALLGGNVLVARRLQDRLRFPRNLIEVRSPATGKVLRQFVLPLPGYVTGLHTTPAGALYVTGSFRRYRPGGRPAHLAVIRVNPLTGALDPGFDPHAHGPVYSWATTKGRVFLSGLFDRLGARRRPGLGAVAPATGAVDVGFRPTRRLQGDASTVLTGLPNSLLQAGYFGDGGRVIDPVTGRLQLTGLAALQGRTAVTARAGGGLVVAQSISLPLGGYDSGELGYLTTLPR